MSAGNFLRSSISSICRVPVRFGSNRRIGKPPEQCQTLEDYLRRMRYKDPELHYEVNIGLPWKVQARKDEMKKRSEFVKKQRSDPSFEKLLVTNQVSISAEEVNEEWIRSYSAPHLRMIAEHYGIFEHLFGDAYFYPVVPLNIVYSHQSLEIPVHRGNVVKPSEAAAAPSVSFEADPNSLWTLALTNPDGHLSSPDSEYVHWLIGNIPGNDVKNGDEVVQYLRPFPPRGTGYQRLVFVLYKQEKKIDLSPYKKSSVNNVSSLNERTFSTYDFYRKNQDDITPAGLAFYQADWDPSVKDFFHNTLDIKEPVFEYDFPEPYIRPQTYFPLKQPFNLYMDKYRDPKQVAKEYFLRRMSKTHPFRGPKKPYPFPGAVKPGTLKEPSWLKYERLKQNLGWGRINDH